MNELYKYIWGVTKNNNCKLYQIGGITNHIHMLIDLHPTIPLSSLLKDIKVASNKYIKNNHLNPDFSGWQSGYGAFTCSIDSKEIIIEYIKNQEEHHKNKTFKEEFIELLEENNIDFNEKYLL